MELVPVVELTLSIFTGLLVLALIISYVSSRLRKHGKKEENIQTVNKAYTTAAYISNNTINAGYQNQYSPLPPEFHSEGEQQNQKLTNKELPKKFTVLNEVPFIQTGYIPENAKNYGDNLASEKAKDTFLMFK